MEINLEIDKIFLPKSLTVLAFPQKSRKAFPASFGAAAMADSCVKVRFIIKPSTKDDDLSIDELKAKLAHSQATHQNLLDNQVGGIDFQVIEPTESDERVLDDLQHERARVEEFEQDIKEITARSRRQAQELMDFAAAEQSEVKKTLSVEARKLEETNVKFRTQAEEYKDYAEVRDRCIQVKILDELLSGDQDDALWGRLKKVTDRISTLDANLQATVVELERAKDEEYRRADDLALPQDELKKLKDSAGVAVWKKFTEISEDDLKLEDTRRRIEKETQERVREMLRDAERAKNAMLSANEKQKLRVLALSQDLSSKERAYKLALLRKKKLQRDFLELKRGLLLHEQKQNATLDTVRQGVVELQESLRTRKMAEGDSVEARLRAFEKKVQVEEAGRWQQELDQIRATKVDSVREINDKAKEIFKQMSSTLGERYSTDFARIIADYEARRAKLQDETSTLQEKLTRVETSLAHSTALQHQQIGDQQQQKAQLKKARSAQEQRLKELKDSVRQLWAKYNVETKFIVKFLHNVSGVSPTDVRVLQKCQGEVKRLRVTKELHDEVEEREALKRDVIGMKKQGLDASTPKSRLDQLASKLWEASKALQSRGAALLRKCKTYKETFDREFLYLGQPYAAQLTAEVSGGDGGLVASPHQAMAAPTDEELAAKLHEDQYVKRTARRKSTIGRLMAASEPAQIQEQRRLQQQSDSNARAAASSRFRGMSGEVDRQLGRLGYDNAAAPTTMRNKRGSVMYSGGSN